MEESRTGVVGTKCRQINVWFTIWFCSNILTKIRTSHGTAINREWGEKFPNCFGSDKKQINIILVIIAIFISSFGLPSSNYCL